MTKQLCPNCSGTSFDSWLIRQVKCRNCGKIWSRDDLSEIPRLRPPTRKASDRQERKNARDVKGKLTIASGATPFDKADVKVKGTLRMECKTTEKGSYVLKRIDLVKITSQAKDDEIPVFMIEFRDNDQISEYAVLPKDWLLQLLPKE